MRRDVMLSGLGNAVRFGAQFARFEQPGNGAVRAWFADGRTDVADVLVGADGIGSTVRGQYLPDVHVVDTGKRMPMGAVPGPDAEVRAGLVNVQILGLATARYVVRVEPIASAGVDDLAAWFGPIIQQCLTRV